MKKNGSLKRKYICKNELKCERSEGKAEIKCTGKKNTMRRFKENVKRMEEKCQFRLAVT